MKITLTQLEVNPSGKDRGTLQACGLKKAGMFRKADGQYASTYLRHVSD